MMHDVLQARYGVVGADPRRRVRFRWTLDVSYGSRIEMALPVACSCLTPSKCQRIELCKSRAWASLGRMWRVCR